LRLMYLLHGWGGSRDGTVRLLGESLKANIPDHWGVSRPQLPHGDRNRPATESVALLHNLSVPPGSLLIGISMGGLVAAKLQEEGRTDHHVIAVSSPTWASGISLEHRWRTDWLSMRPEME
jgi:esterase/lipase